MLSYSFCRQLCHGSVRNVLRLTGCDRKQLSSSGGGKVDSETGQDDLGKRNTSESNSNDDTIKDNKDDDFRYEQMFTAKRPKFSFAERDAMWYKYRKRVASIVDDFTEDAYPRGWRYPQMADHFIEIRMEDPHSRVGLRDIFTSRSQLPKNILESKAKRSIDPTVLEQTVDVVVIGSGIMGLSAAYALKIAGKESIRVLVVDRDLNFTHASTTLSLGCIRQQFSHPINIALAQAGARYFRKAKDNLSFIGVEPLDLQYHPQGFLILVEEERAERFLEYHKQQTELGAFVEILSPQMLEQRYPWLDLDGVVLGSIGLQDEGWINPYPLMAGLKGKCEFLGVQFVEGEVFDFNTRFYKEAAGIRDENGDLKESCHHALVRLAHDKIYQLDFTKLFVCAGAENAALAKRLGIGMGQGMRRIPYPVVPKKRYVYVINAPNAPVLDFPILVDTSGVICRREGLGGNYIVTKVPTPEEEPDPGNLDVDYSYYYNVILPLLSNRCAGFDNAKIVSAWAGYCDENVWDGSPILGNHPYYDNIWWMGGFSSHGMQMAGPAATTLANGCLRGVYEEEFIDLTKFNWMRLFANERVVEELNF